MVDRVSRNTGIVWGSPCSPIAPSCRSLRTFGSSHDSTRVRRYALRASALSMAYRRYIYRCIRRWNDSLESYLSPAWCRTRPRPGSSDRPPTPLRGPGSNRCSVLWSRRLPNGYFLYCHRGKGLFCHMEKSNSAQPSNTPVQTA